MFRANGNAKSSSLMRSPRRGAKFEKRLSKGEFVRRDIPAEEHQLARQ
jgi:hypothetical protein